MQKKKGKTATVHLTVSKIVALLNHFNNFYHKKWIIFTWEEPKKKAIAIKGSVRKR